VCDVGLAAPTECDYGMRLGISEVEPISFEAVNERLDLGSDRRRLLGNFFRPGCEEWVVGQAHIDSPAHMCSSAPPPFAIAPSQLAARAAATR
jgi:hypothetical protein